MRRVGGTTRHDLIGGRRFDAWTRGLQQRLARRDALTDVLKVGAGGALGLVGLTAVTEPTLAKSCKNNSDCPPGKKCKNKKKQNNGKRRGRCK